MWRRGPGGPRPVPREEKLQASSSFFEKEQFFLPLVCRLISLNIAMSLRGRAVMPDRSAQDAWVGRVLGVSVGGGDDAPPDELDQELESWRQGLLEQAARLTDNEARQRIRDLGEQAGTLIAEGSLGAAHSILDAMDTALNQARRSATNREVISDSGNKVEFAKLLLRWRQAQSDTRERIKHLASGILADPEVKADPRFDDVVEAAADLVDVMPDFGGDLEDLLDGLDKITDPEQRALQVEAARREIDLCRATLDNADELSELADFAGDEYGEADLAGSLREALTELAGELAGRI
jgi:hypothetical protein